jgi:outer membrane protein assembly factor BamB
MRIERNKTTAIMIALFMMSTLAATTITCVNAQETLTGTFQTYAFINVAPNPCGVGQTAVVQFWLSITPPNAEVQGGARWTDMAVSVTKPDGTTQTLGSFTSDAVGAGATTYAPATTGNYTFKLSFPQQTKTGSITPLFGGPAQPFNYTYLASTASFTLVVQQEPAPSVVVPPLPSSYWTRPINAQNEGWSSISGNWLMAAWDSTTRQFDQGAAYAPYATAPASPHVLWTKPLTFGGLTGGEFGTVAFHNGMSYEQFFKPPVIISGRLYYTTIGAEEPITGITCVDMSTGTTLFTIPDATLSFGQLYNFISPNQGGTHAYLWDTSAGTTWKMYDAWTGQYILSIANVSSGTVLLDNTFYPTPGPGDILVYSLDPATQTLTMWNSTLVFQAYMAEMQKIMAVAFNIWMWRPYLWAGQTLDGSLGIQWTKTLTNMPVGGSIAQVGYDDTVYVYNTTVPATQTFGFPVVSSWCGYSMTDGHLLWGPITLDTTSKLPKDSTGFSGVGILQHQGFGSGGILPIFDRDTTQIYAWNIQTGQFLWGPTPALTKPLGMFNWQITWIVNGILYNSGYDGMIHAYNATTGNHLWDFSSGDAGTMTPYGTWPLYNGLTIVGTGADSTLIATTGEHGNGVQPLYMGEGLYALNAVNGTQLWNVTGWFCQPAFADGMMVSQNLYDNQIYCFGKGPSATAVEAPMTAITAGDTAVIQGTVTDQSAGAKAKVQSGEFNVVPAVSDESMNAWMQYVYEQQPIPKNAAGVEVTLDAVDPNNNFVHIGTVTTDTSGTFGYAWTTPNVPGKYTIIATFAGSDSYYASYAQTFAFVSEAPAATPTPTPTVLPPTETYITVATIVLLIAVAIATILILRKRP